MKIKSKDNCR